MGVAASCEHSALFLQVSQVLWFTLPVLGAVILHLLVDWLFPVPGPPFELWAISPLPVYGLRKESSQDPSVALAFPVFQ